LILSTNKIETNKADTTFFYGYVVVMAAFVIFLVVFGIHYAFGVFLKPLLAEFGWGRAITSGAFSLSWLLQGLSAIVMGRLNDRYGPRIVLTLCGILLSSGFLLTTRIHAGWQLYLTYGVLVGVGTGGVYVPLISTIARWFIARRSTMTGIAVSGMGLGTFLLSPVANYLISIYNWRTAYTILGIALFAVILLAVQFLRRAPEVMRQVPYGHSEKFKDQFRDESKIFSLKEAAFTRSFWLVFGMFFCFGFCFSAVMVHIAPHATDIGKSSSAAAGLVASIGIASIAGKILLGGLGDRTGNRKIYMICFSMMAASLLWLTPAREAWLIYLFAIVFGLAYGGNATSQSPLVASLFGLQSHGLIMGTVNNGFTIGATLGPVACGSLFDLIGDYRAAFLVISAVAVAGLIFTLFLKPPKAFRLP
jgi:MFS transporter, OFA family, oxalate/formate antiporter